MKRINKEKLQIFAGVGIMTLALLIHMGLNINPNSKNRQVALNNSQKITATKEIEEDEKDKRRGR